jgi:hypothetical protein
LGSQLRLGETTTAALFSAGQPSSRPGRSYRYCVAGSHRTVAVAFNARGRIALIGATARATRAGALHPGARVGRRRGLHRIARGLWAGHSLAHGARFVYGVRAGRVRFVAVAARADVRHARRLRADLRAAGL